jgi:hypothetical protein
MHFGGMPGGGMRFGGMPARGMFMGRSAFFPGAGRFAAPFAGRRLAVNRFNNPFFFHNRFFPFRHRFFRNHFFFAGVPFGVGYYGGCWRQVWTGYGYQWVNVCYGYGY